MAGAGRKTDAVWTYLKKYLQSSGKKEIKLNAKAVAC